MSDRGEFTGFLTPGRLIWQIESIKVEVKEGQIALVINQKDTLNLIGDKSVMLAGCVETTHFTLSEAQELYEQLGEAISQLEPLGSK